MLLNNLIIKEIESIIIHDKYEKIYSKLMDLPLSILEYNFVNDNNSNNIYYHKINKKNTRIFDYNIDVNEIYQNKILDDLILININHIYANILFNLVVNDIIELRDNIKPFLYTFLLYKQKKGEVNNFVDIFLRVSYIKLNYNIQMKIKEILSIILKDFTDKFDHIYYDTDMIYINKNSYIKNRENIREYFNNYDLEFEIENISQFYIIDKKRYIKLGDDGIYKSVGLHKTSQLNKLLDTMKIEQRNKMINKII